MKAAEEQLLIFEGASVGRYPQRSRPSEQRRKNRQPASAHGVVEIQAKGHKAFWLRGVARRAVCWLGAYSPLRGCSRQTASPAAHGLPGRCFASATAYHNGLYAIYSVFPLAQGILTRCCITLLFVTIIRTMLHVLGRKTLQIIFGFGDFALFTARSFCSVLNSRRLGKRILRAMYEQGTVCLPVILIVGIFTGLVLGLQGYHVLNRFGSSGLLGALVSLSLIREMAPVLASLMLVGQAGSALAAELGMQRQTEQIVALETMGIESRGYLVAPRLIASLFTFPTQTALFVVLGLWGGALSGSVLLGVDSGVYWSSVERAVEARDLRECFVKAILFGLLSISLCAYQGFHADRNRSVTGARAVSAATTRAVVLSSILILVVDYAVSSFFVR